MASFHAFARLVPVEGATGLAGDVCLCIWHDPSGPNAVGADATMSPQDARDLAARLLTAADEAEAVQPGAREGSAL